MIPAPTKMNLVAAHSTLAHHEADKALMHHAKAVTFGKRDPLKTAEIAKHRALARSALKQVVHHNKAYFKLTGKHAIEPGTEKRTRLQQLATFFKKHLGRSSAIPAKIAPA